MVYDPSNPFHQLAKKLSSRRQAEAQTPASDRNHACGSKMPSHHGAAVQRPFDAQDEICAQGEDDEDDFSLFLNSVNAVQLIQNARDKRASAVAGRPLQKHAPRSSGCSGLPAPDQPLRGDPSGSAPLQSNLPAREQGKGASSRARTAQGEVKASAARSSRRSALPAEGDSAAPTGRRAASFQAMQAALVPDAAQDTADAAVDEEALLFIKSTQGVTPLISRGREVPLPAGKKKNALPADPAKALRDLLEGSLEFALYHSDEFMEGHVVGIDPMLLARLRAGRFSPEAHLDLHGQNAAQAQTSLIWFVKNAYQRSMRTLLVVTGRGRNSPDGIGVLRPLLQQWLSRDPFKRVVLAFCTAKPGDGGPGALYVLLRKYKKSRGKILWDRCPSSEDYPDM
jgi:DNA-nicking Smr family endonuclease